MSFDPQVRQADERFGDFQANGILPYAKKAGQLTLVNLHKD